MSAGLLHVRIGKTGDVLVFTSPLRELFLLTHTLRRAFVNHPDVVHWRHVTAPHGLACMRWAWSDHLDFELVNVRDYLDQDAPPNTKGLKVFRADGRQLLYLPCDVWPEQAAAIRDRRPEIRDVVTPRIAGFASRQSFELAEFVPARVQHLEFEIPEPDVHLPVPLRQTVQSALSSDPKPGLEGDYQL